MSKNSEKNLILAMAISMMILFGSQMLFKTNIKKPEIPPVVNVLNTGEKDSREIEKKQFLQNENDTAALGSEKLTETEQVIDTGKIIAVFSSKGASLKSLTVKDANHKEDNIYFENDPGKRIFAMDTALEAALSRKIFAVKEGDGFVEYRYLVPGKGEIVKKFIYKKDGDIVQAQIKIKNTSAQDLEVAYDMIGAAGLRSVDEGGRKFLQIDASFGGKVWRVKDGKKEKQKSGDVGWVALKNRYFATIMKPLTPFKRVLVRSTDGKDLVSIVSSQEYALAPGVIRTDDMNFYAGRLDEAAIKPLGEDVLGVVDLGVFGGVSRFLLKVMRFFHGITKNWGISIILLTVAINLLLFPLTIKSFTSMQQMKKIQPHVDKLKELHKDNPQRMNREVMELYKKYNVNPLGGCLPLVLQMPIFIALYQALNNSIELKGSTFLWITDLSKADGIQIPMNLPVIGNKINILPLLMVVAMFLQQRISQNTAGGPSSPEQASQQKMMMIVFPLVFGFMFYNMPAGLVLYWLTNTVLMTIEQGMISKKQAQ